MKRVWPLALSSKEVPTIQPMLNALMPSQGAVVVPISNADTAMQLDEFVLAETFTPRPRPSRKLETYNPHPDYRAGMPAPTQYV